MKKIAPVAAMLVLAAALVVVMWFALNSTAPAANTPSNTPQAPLKNRDFKAEDFMLEFDLDGDGKVTLEEEFKMRYGEGDPPLVFTVKDGAPPLSAEDAFKRWDRDHNGIIDAEDIRQVTDKEWIEHGERAAARGLHLVSWNKQEMELNEQQFATFERERGAHARGELPFGGAFWASEYLHARWARLDDGHEVIEGYATQRNARWFVLTAAAEIKVKEPSKVTVTELPADDPHNLYAAEIEKTPFDAPAKNLALARKCKQWGMPVEAGMLYARVLVFERGNDEALTALNYRLDGEKYVPKG